MLKIQNELKLYGTGENLYESNGLPLAAVDGDLTVELKAPAFIESYDNSKLIDVRFSQSFSPISLDIKPGTLEVALNAPPESEATAAAKIALYRNGKIVGMFFNANGTNDLRGLVKLNAADAFSRLANSRFLGRFLSEVQAKSLIDEIANAAGISILYDVESVEDSLGNAVALEDIYVSGYLHGGTASEALVKICFACGFAIKVTEDGGLRIVAALAQGAYTEVDSVSASTQIQYATYYSDFLISRNKYVLDKTSDKETVLSETLENGAYRYEFDEPHARYEIKNGVLVESGSNFVEFGVTATSADVEIKGSPYKKVTLLERFANPVQAGSKNVFEVNDIEIASNVGGEMRRVFAYISGAGRRKSVSADVLLQTLDNSVLDGVCLEMQGTSLNAIPESVSYYLNANDKIYAKIQASEVEA